MSGVVMGAANRKPRCRQRDSFTTPTGKVFPGKFRNQEVIVRRIPRFKLRHVPREFAIIQTLSHPNLVQLIDVYSDKSFSFLAYELCAATLEDHCTMNYLGKMPNPDQVLLQLASGLEYIHHKRLIHGEIRPTNVLISLSRPVQVKWSDFGLSAAFTRKSSYYTEGMTGTLYWMAPEMLSVYRSSSDFNLMAGSVAADIFATGCVFLYFLTRGSHPFGDDDAIVSNILLGNAVHLNKLSANHFASDLISRMIRKSPEARMSLLEVIGQLNGCGVHTSFGRTNAAQQESMSGSRQTHADISHRLVCNEENDVSRSASVVVANITIVAPTLETEAQVHTIGSRAQPPCFRERGRQSLHSFTSARTPEPVVDSSTACNQCGDMLSVKWNEDEWLGRGGFGDVFAGYLGRRKIAVKRIKLENLNEQLPEREESVMRQFDHPNVLRLLFVLQNQQYKYFGLEYCQGSIEDFCNDKYRGPMPTDLEALMQMTAGLHYIHSCRFVHRDVKPSNVLVSSATPVALKWSDFGLSKPLSAGDTFSGVVGTSVWLAPELMAMQKVRQQGSIRSCGDTRSDVFSAGCVFFYLLTRGVHPFGSNHYAICAKIMEGDPVKFNELPRDHYAFQIVRRMIEKSVEERATLATVLHHLHQSETEFKSISTDCK